MLSDAPEQTTDDLTVVCEDLDSSYVDESEVDSEEAKLIVEEAEEVLSSICAREDVNEERKDN